MVLSGIILLIAGIVLFFVQRHQNQKVFSLKSARPMSAAALSETAGAVADEIGGGSWRDYVKLWGEVVVDRPLHSEHKGEACVHYVSKVIREYETTEITQTDSGTSKTERRRKSETITNNQRSIPFWLRDRTGTVKVNLEGAAIETLSILDEFRPQHSGNTLGYRYQESVLPVGRNVLIVGAVSDLTGEVIIGKPVQSAHKYIISLRDEEALTATISRHAKISFYAMLGCLGLGIVVLILGILD
ncbi:MAG: E3 ubiquitin ligase family protein [Leptolyngbya sp. SIO1E4]|nr:E3 ubiquitin ligase family protein [Leptolyngbya sp. SIO1E4]